MLEERLEQVLRLFAVDIQIDLFRPVNTVAERRPDAFNFASRFDFNIQKWMLWLAQENLIHIFLRRIAIRPDFVERDEQVRPFAGPPVFEKVLEVNRMA